MDMKKRIKYTPLSRTVCGSKYLQYMKKDTPYNGKEHFYDFMGWILSKGYYLRFMELVIRSNTVLIEHLLHQYSCDVVACRKEKERREYIRRNINNPNNGSILYWDF